MQDDKSSAIILLYHGVTASPSVGIENFQTKHMPVQEFERQMDYLQHFTTPMTLRELANYLQTDSVMPRIV